MLVGHTCIIVATVFLRIGTARRTTGTVSIISSESFSQKFADLPSINFHLKIINEDQLIGKLEKALQASSTEKQSFISKVTY